MEFLETFGINWRLLAAQIVNFLILLLVLHRFLYKPIIRILEKRKKDIEENEKRTAFLERRMEETEQTYKEKMREAEREVVRRMEEAAKKAEETRRELVEEGEKERRRIVEEAKREARQEGERQKEELRKETKTLIKEGVKKILEHIGDERAENALWTRAEKEINASLYEKE